MRTHPAILFSAALVLLSACRERDLGTGANTLDREVARPAPDVWAAAVRAVESSNLQVCSDQHDRFGGELVANRANGDEVRIGVKSLSEKSTRVSVRVEPGDRALATLLHERMAEKLGLGTAKAGLFGGGECHGTYATDLDSCLAGARRTFAALGISTIREDVHPSGWTLEGRRQESTPVRISGEKKGDLSTRMTFVAGTNKDDVDEAYARKMRVEFEATIHLEASTD